MMNMNAFLTGNIMPVTRFLSEVLVRFGYHLFDTL